MNNDVTPPAIENADVTTVEQLQKRITVGMANNYRRIRNRIRADLIKRRNAKIQRCKRVLSLLIRAGDTPSHALRSAAKLAHAPVPCKLKGPIKQAGRSWMRLDKASDRATKVRAQRTLDATKNLIDSGTPLDENTIKNLRNVIHELDQKPT